MTYQIIDNIFVNSDLASSAAEAHGLATGMLCVNKQADGSAWLKQLFEDETALNDRDKRILLQLFEEGHDSPDLRCGRQPDWYRPHGITDVLAAKDMALPGMAR